VSRVEDLTPTIKGIWIRLDGPSLDFQAGQYINLQLPDGIGSRAFSIANAPGDGTEIELNVRLVPGGAATSWIHNRLKARDRLSLTGPYGRFFVRKSAGLPSLFMAGGSGLSSPRSMILDLLSEGSQLPIALIHGARNRAELYYHDEFVRLAREHSHFTYLPALSDEPESSSWHGFRGHASSAAKTLFEGDFRGRKAYLCGPRAMVEDCISTLMQGRLFERDIYTERFLAASDSGTTRSPLFKCI
jgi:phenol/toluene 2-monooxygenase (NADH) P5/A5